MANRALIIVDTQVDFCEGGSLAVNGGAEVASKIRELMYQMDNGEPIYPIVIATADWHVDPGEHFASAKGEKPDFANTWPDHCVADTPGAEFHPNLQLHPNIPVFRKGEHQAAYSGFEGTLITHGSGGARPWSLDKYLKDHDVDEVDVVGIATDYCVKATALDSAKNGFKTRVLTEYCAAVSPDTTGAEAIAEMMDAGVWMA